METQLPMDSQILDKDSDLWRTEPQNTTNLGEEAEEEETRTDDELLAECSDDDTVPQHDPLCVQVPYGSEALLELEREQSPERAKIFENTRTSPPWGTHPEPDSQIPPHTPPAHAEEPRGGEESPAISPTELESTPAKEVHSVLDSDDDKKGTFKENNRLKTVICIELTCFTSPLGSTFHHACMHACPNRFPGHEAFGGAPRSARDFECPS